MELHVIMSDADYQRVVAAQGKRVCGSVGLINPKHVDFHAWNTSASEPDETPAKVLRTERGRTVIRPRGIRFTVLVEQGNGDPATAIYDEADQATLFIRNNSLAN